MVTRFRILLNKTEYLEHQTEFRLVLILSEKSNYNPNFVWFNKDSKHLSVIQLQWLTLVTTKTLNIKSDM